MALDYDFYIGALGFNTRVTRETPYERATAQFRKEQIDQASTVGDQSLTGWWTRGQLSFHRGAGVNYYEVLEGETVLNRFKDSEGIEVFTPGRVTLTKELDSFGVAATDAVAGPLDGGGGVYALTSTGVEYTNGTGTLVLPTSDAVAPTSITSSGQLYYLTNGTKVERQYAAADARVNHVTNPSFEADVSGWTKSHEVVTLNRVTGSGKYGNSYLYANYGSGLEGQTIWVEATVDGLTIGTVYVASAWVLMGPEYNNVTEVPLTMSINGATADTGTAREQWVNLRLTFTASATSHTLRFTQPAAEPDLTPDTIHLDAVLVTESPFAGDYFDGAQPGCSWQGTPHLSKSNYVTASSGASTVRITTTDAAWQKVFWAKGRIWAVDDVNRWYALADAVASTTAADAFWSSNNENPRWSLADSPGPVYISDGSDIFAVTVDTDGLVPSLGTPTTAVRLPLGEQVIDIAYYLSNLVVVTTRGVRVAVVQNDRLFLGPLTVKGDFSSCTRIGSFNTVVYVAGRLDGRGGDVVLCAIDLATANEDITFPWAPLVTLSTDSSTANGCAVDAAGRIYAWSAGDLQGASLDELTASGYVTTGFHRFGTLDSKHFATVSVRLSGTGSVEVFKIDGSDVETSLGTLDAAEGVAEVALTGDPAERIGLKFVLARNPLDSTKGPTLLGYQLKALPLPKRQRMIRVPLMLHDAEQNRNGQRMQTDSWARLEALEALEGSNAVVTYDDKLTGETGSAYVESIEVQRTAPKDFGGLLYVTLRVI